MKTAGLCVVCAMGAFVVMHLQLSGQMGSDDPAADAKKAEPAAKFPDDLTPALRSEPVKQAAPFRPSSEAHPMVVLARSGKLHPWHEQQRPEWMAESVETTELVVVVGQQRKTLLQVQSYANGAPPIRRYRYDLDAWLVEAKTGKEIARKRFTTVARPIRPRELWELTELGDPVEWAPVGQWAREEATAHAEELVAGK